MILEYFLKDHTTIIEKARSSLFLSEDMFISLCINLLCFMWQQSTNCGIKMKVQVEQTK